MWDTVISKIDGKDSIPAPPQFKKRAWGRKNFRSVSVFPVRFSEKMFGDKLRREAFGQDRFHPLLLSAYHLSPEYSKIVIEFLIH